MPSVTFRNYHPDSGALLGNISVLDFGTISLGTHSPVKVIDIAFEDVTIVGNIKLGLISTGGITVNGHFGISQSVDFDSSKANSPVSDHFSGINTTGTSSDTSNYAITNRSNTLSNYIYLDLELGSTNISAGTGAYKVFFDFS